MGVPSSPSGAPHGKLGSLTPIRRQCHVFSSFSLPLRPPQRSLGHRIRVQVNLRPSRESESGFKVDRQGHLGLAVILTASYDFPSFIIFFPLSVNDCDERFFFFF